MVPNSILTWQQSELQFACVPEETLFCRQIPPHIKSETSYDLNLMQNSKILGVKSIMCISSGWMFWN